MKKIHREKIGRSVSEAWKSKDTFEKKQGTLMKLILYGNVFGKNPEITKQKISKTMTKIWGSRNLKEKEMIRKKNSDSCKKNIKENPEKYRLRGINGAIASQRVQRFNGGIRKTSIERKTEEIINDLNLPYKYTGLGDVWIKNMNPDFFNTNGQKKVIEVLGSYWHNKEETQQRANKYKEYGYCMLPIWDYELKESWDDVRQKIIDFDKL